MKSLSFDPAEPAVIYTPGDGSAFFFTDDMRNKPWESMSAIERAVLVTRLRAFADQIEGGVPS